MTSNIKKIKYFFINFFHLNNKFFKNFSRKIFHFSLGRSLRHLEEFYNNIKQLTPGPASYKNTLTAFDTSKAIKFGKEEKLKLAKSFSPGPGNYDV